jgi:hypothetical protein
MNVGGLDEIPDNANVQVILIDGTTVIGVFRRSAGWPWVSVDGQDAFSLTQQNVQLSLVS